LMARVGVARVSLPGGCAIGARPVEFALEGAGADGGGDWHFSRIHRGEGPRQWTSRQTAEGRANRVRENHGDGDGKYFNGSGAGRR